MLEKGRALALPQLFAREGSPAVAPPPPISSDNIEYSAGLMALPIKKPRIVKTLGDVPIRGGGILSR